MSQKTQDEFQQLRDLAHDLRNPMSTVGHYIDLIRRAGPLNQRQEQLADQARTLLDHIDTIISETLEYGRINGDALNIADCNLSLIIKSAYDVISHVAVEYNVTIHLNIDGANAIVQGDSRLLRQVVHNLLSNAVKYNHVGGQVWVTVLADNVAARIIVRDNGRGIPTSALDRIFDHYFRVNSALDERTKGTGLGLAMVKSFVERHGGNVYVESVYGEGSVFTVVLPRYQHGESYHDIHDGHRESLDDVDDDDQESPDHLDTDSGADRW